MAKKKIRRLAVSGFRGVRRSITLDFSRRFDSMLIYGANAKGKSSLGDAVEWFYTGAIAELNKEGCTRDDYRHRLLDESEDTSVGFEFSDTALNSDFVLLSSLRQSHSNDTDEFSDYREASKDELLILRHKDLKQFVDETKTYKRKHIARLIGMEGWEQIRDDMLAVENRVSGDLAQLRERQNDREAEVAELTGSRPFTRKAGWNYAEQQAKVLGISHSIKSLSSLKKADEEAKATAVATERAAILNQLQRAESVLGKLEDTPPKTTPLDRFAEIFNEICAQPDKVLWQQLSELYKHGKAILKSGLWSEDTCPLCGLRIPQDELVAHIKKHEAKSAEIQDEMDQLDAARAKAKRGLQGISNTISDINSLKMDDIEELGRLKTSGSEVALALADAKALTEQKLKTFASIDLRKLMLDDKLEDMVAEARKALTAVKKTKEALTPTAVEKARIEAFQNLSNLSAHIAVLDAIAAETKPLERQVTSMQAFTTAFEGLRRKTMGDVLEIISNDVSRYFLQLHPDEGFDGVKLQFLPDVDGVEFHIYYKGEEIIPPRKFLSESYLSGLGVCLFLATVRAFNKENGFIVLDDIVNSFDAEHRADLARLLVNEFEDFQLIILTHDGVWFNFLRRLAQAGWQHKRIRGWSYEEGVDIEQAPSDELSECEQAINSGQVDYAAPKVRSYMENRLKGLSHNLGVRVRFKPGSLSDERMIGELLPEMRSYLRERSFFEKVDEKSFNELEASAFVVNYGSHDRTPEESGLVMGDVKFALKRMCDLEELFYCPDCTKGVWNLVSRDYEMRCKCGHLSL